MDVTNEWTYGICEGYKSYNYLNILELNKNLIKKKSCYFEINQLR
jgi:hypothetical protein